MIKMTFFMCALFMGNQLLAQSIEKGKNTQGGIKMEKIQKTDKQVVQRTSVQKNRNVQGDKVQDLKKYEALEQKKMR